MASAINSPMGSSAASGQGSLFGNVMPLLAPFSYPSLPSDYASLINSRWQTLAAGAERLAARVVAVKRETASSRSLELKPGPGWKGHVAGQFINVHVNINGVWHSRCYSISSSDRRRRRLKITVRAIGGGLVSKYLVHSAKVGERLDISQAQGEFVLPAEDVTATGKKRLFITAGSGITPVMGMLSSMEKHADCVHIHYERSSDEVVFADRMREMNGSDDAYQLHEIHTAKGGEHFTAGQLEELCDDWRERDVWACGPAALLDATSNHWQQAGLSRQLKTERFQAQVVSLDAAAEGGTARFTTSDVTADGAADEPLLQVAERAGLVPVSGCRMGICHSCDCTLVSGAVRDLRTGKVTNQTGVKIQPCVSAAAGSVELDL